MLFAPNIIDPGLEWNENLIPRTKTEMVIVHHAAGDGSVYTVHDYHKNVRGWTGIAYNFYIRKDGSVYQGRGWDKVGGHTLKEDGIDYNSISVGICCEGNCDTNETPPDAQLASLIKMVAWALENYTLTQSDVFGHNECNVKNYTVCPGKNFPLTEVKNAAGKYSEVASGCLQLFDRGVIDSPEYWVNCFWKLPNLDTLLIRLGYYCTRNTNGRVYSSVDSALTQLVIAGIIDSPDYWRNNYTKIQYLGDLIKSAASHTRI